MGEAGLVWSHRPLAGHPRVSGSHGAPRCLIQPAACTAGHSLHTPLIDTLREQASCLSSGLTCAAVATHVGWGHAIYKCAVNEK